MKSEKEIRELYDKLSDNELIVSLNKEGFVKYSDKGGHWLDCLDWILRED